MSSSPAPARIADRLDQARRRRFVGRTAELAEFTALLAAPELPIAVLAVCGPAGIGKTALLLRLADLSREAGVGVVHLDARDLPTTPEALLDAVAAVRPEGRQVLLLDTYELLSDLDTWVRRELVPRLPADTLVVLAGRYPPSPAWSGEPGWADLLRVWQLRNLTPEEASGYLAAVAVPAPLRARAAAVTHGFPLALAMVGQVAASGGDFTFEDSPRLVQDLLERLLDGVPGSGPAGAHRRALECCAHVRVLDEPLLAAMSADLPDADAVPELFAWLRRLPVVDPGPDGLRLHDLPRELLVADLRWRDPQRRRELHRRARAHLLGRTAGASDADRQRVLLDLMHLHDELRAVLRAADPSGLRVGPLTAAEAAAVPALVERHEGAGAVPHARYWLAAQPAAWRAVRDADGELAGVYAMVDLTAAHDDAGAGADPAVAAARGELARRPPLRPGERADLLRFWLCARTYQGVGPVQSRITTALIVHCLTTPGLAFTLVPLADPQLWAPFLAYGGHSPWPGADFEIDGRHWSVFGHDWRAVPVETWMQGLADQEPADPVTAGGGAGPPAAVPRPAVEEVLVLSRPEFAAAVRAALRDLHRPDRLRTNPLLRARCVTAAPRPSGGDPDGGEPEGRGVDAARTGPAALRAVVLRASGTLQASPRDEKLFRALNRAYLRPAATQEQAAELLGLPSSTFRRHLSAAVARIVDLLWAAEVTGDVRLDLPAGGG